MNIDELRSLAEATLSRWKKAEGALKNEYPHMYLVLVYKRKPPSGDKVRLFKTRGPFGFVANVKKARHKEFEVCAVFDARAVLKSLPL